MTPTISEKAFEDHIECALLLENYTTYHTYWRLHKTIEDDPRSEKGKANYLLRSFVDLHEHAIAQKVQITRPMPSRRPSTPTTRPQSSRRAPIPTCSTTPSGGTSERWWGSMSGGTCPWSGRISRKEKTPGRSTPEPIEPLSIAWDAFGWKNGAATHSDVWRRITRLRREHPRP
ncbi:MAG: hypothetical protein ACE5GJ_13460 [Gemmatimonadota bacterium]